MLAVAGGQWQAPLRVLPATAGLFAPALLDIPAVVLYIKSGLLDSRTIKCNLYYEYCEERFVMHDLLHELARSV